jgi:hypothetical protein
MVRMELIICIHGWTSVPKRKLIMPRMPAMLDTRLEPSSFPSFNLKSPDGLSTTRVGAEGVEGEEKA